MKKNYKIGDLLLVEGMECRVRFVNCGMAYVCPTEDTLHDPRIARHIAYARIDEKGKITRL